MKYLLASALTCLLFAFAAQNSYCLTGISKISTVNITASADTICAGQSTLLTATGADTYTWEPGNYTGSSVVVNPSQTTTYTIASNANDTTFYTITVLPSVITVGNSALSICTGEKLLMLPEGSAEYIWEPMDGLELGGGDSVWASPTQTTVYTVTGTNYMGCPAYGEITVAVLPTPVITFTLSDSIICPNAPVTITVSGAMYYTWEASSVLDTTEGSTVIATPFENSQFIVTASDPLGCLTIDTIRVQVYLAPDFNAEVVPDDGNKNGEITLHISGGMPPYQYQLLGQSFQNDSVFSGLDDSLYTIIVRDGRGCLFSDTVRVIEILTRDIAASSRINELSIYPNPTQSSSTLTFVASIAETCALNIRNELGSIVYTQSVRLQKGVNCLPLALSLPSGLYCLELVNSRTLGRSKFVIAK